MRNPRPTFQQLRALPDHPEPTWSQTHQPDPGQAGMDELQAVTALQDVFVPSMDWSAPCGHPIPRPRQLEDRLVQGQRKGDLWCNRPRNHQGPHRVYSPEFHYLAEAER